MSSERLLTNKTFDQLIKDCSDIIQKIKNFNDELQSNDPEDYDNT